MTSPEICLGVTGSIAAYKSCELARLLVKGGYRVSTVMTANATEFVRPLTFRALTSRPVITDMFADAEDYDTEHVSIAHRAAAIVIAPATANIIAKFAHGIADDFLTTTVLAAECPVIVAPAMNQSMVGNPLYKENENKLRALGFLFVDPGVGELACGEVGAGRMAEPAEIVQTVDAVVRTAQSLAGEKVLITAGPTREFIDPVRFISNPSTGKMGYEIARAAAWRGAHVTLVSGPTSETPPFGVHFVPVTSASEMNETVIARAGECTVFIAAAAVADHKPVSQSEQKIKKDDGKTTLVLDLTDDILANVAAGKTPGQLIVGFAAETENMIENAGAKLAAKQLDMIVANRVDTAAGGFASDDNAASILFANGRDRRDIALTSKRLLAAQIMDEIAELRRDRSSEGTVSS
jgi:phosphopantothenoylcysteine decarboxylase/phosphopantothenate--cysteine ligase